MALQEVGSPAVADDMARLLQAEFGLVYQPTVLPGPGAQNSEFPLNTGFLTRSGRVALVEASLRQGCSGVDYEVVDGAACGPGLYPLFNRPPLVVTVQVTGDWPGVYTITLINNHWKSKGGDESVNVIRREAQADHVAALVHEITQQTPDAHVIVAGDLNDFPDSVPVQALRKGVDPNLINAIELLPPLEQYTYIFNSASQVLDYLLLTPNMLPALVEVNPLRINADFASPASIDANSTLHSSDHDPIMLRFRPEGGAWLAADWSWPDIQLTLVTRDGLPTTAATTEANTVATTDAKGSARIWNLTPGTYQLNYQLPGNLVGAAGTEPLEIELVGGVNQIEMPKLQHATVLSTTGEILGLIAFDGLLAEPTDSTPAR
ncbi:MAG: hypothetical protein HC802_17785 [Caldilineaceae bacterium]|nr:hypothetical protein [Caldilineaceae bacterium]